MYVCMCLCVCFLSFFCACLCVRVIEDKGSVACVEEWRWKDEVCVGGRVIKDWKQQE